MQARWDDDRVDRDEYLTEGYDEPNRAGLGAYHSYDDYGHPGFNSPASTSRPGGFDPYATQPSPMHVPRMSQYAHRTSEYDAYSTPHDGQPRTSAYSDHHGGIDPYANPGGYDRTSGYSAYSNDNGGIDFSKAPKNYYLQNEFGGYEHIEPGWEVVGPPPSNPNLVKRLSHGDYGTSLSHEGYGVSSSHEDYDNRMSAFSHGYPHPQMDAYDANYDRYDHERKSDDYALSGVVSADPKSPLENENDVDDVELRRQNAISRGLTRIFGAGVEARGIERVPEHERDGRHTIGLMLLWWSVNCVVSTFPIGLLAQVYFKLSFRMAVAAIVVFTAIGAACCGFIATLGPKTGLRTIVISRYSVGFFGGTIFAVLNILTQLGFSCTAVILGGQTLTNVSEGKLPLEASIVIVGFMGLVLCFVGYEAVHYWERFAWIVQFVFYCCILALAGLKGYQVDNSQSSMSTGKEFAGGFLSFGGIVFASAAGWAPIAADFNCRLPATISAWKVFILTWFGLMIPLLFIEITSAAVITVPAYAAAFENGDAGGVLFEIFRPWKAGGKFILVVMSFSIIANIAPNTYSASLSAQTLLPLFQKIPRAIWCIFMFCVYTAAAIGGREHFSEVLSNFLSILGYWIAFFIVVVFEEHFIFRRKLGYDLTAYNSLKRLPVGIAGILACCCGVGCAVVGMAQVWFIGPVGKLFGPEGGDLGFEMCAVATAVVYPPLRWVEIRIFKR